MRFSRNRPAQRALAILFLSVIATCLTGNVKADDRKGLTDLAYQAYLSGDFKQALELYRQAGADIPEAAGLEFNKGDAHYKLGDFEQALKTFEKAALTDNNELAAGAHYNSGNTYFQKQDFQHAVEQYKSALRRNPDDSDAQRNLEIALRSLQQQQQQQDKDKDKEENKDDQEDKQEQQNQQEKQDEQDKKDKQDQKNQEQQPKPDSSQSKPQQKPQKSNPYQMSKEDAERLLNALKDEERKHQKNKRMVSAKVYNGKDW